MILAINKDIFTISAFVENVNCNTSTKSNKQWIGNIELKVKALVSLESELSEPGNQGGMYFPPPTPGFSDFPWISSLSKLVSPYFQKSVLHRIRKLNRTKLSPFFGLNLYESVFIWIFWTFVLSKKLLKLLVSYYLIKEYGILISCWSIAPGIVFD